MAGFVVKYRAQARNEIGRFMATYDANEARAVAESAEDLARLARANAPVRTGRLRASIFAVPRGKSATVESHNDHAAPQEYGAGPHDIPNAFGLGFTVHHPGNPATHFLARAADAMRERFVRAIERAFPS